MNNPLTVDVGVKAGNGSTSCGTQLVGKLGIQLRANATGPVVEHGVPEASVWPVVPANKRAAVEHTEGVLNAGLVVAVGDTETVGEGAILVVHHQGVRTVEENTVSGVVAGVA